MTAMRDGERAKGTGEMVAEKPRVNLLNTYIDNVTMADALERIETYIRSRRPHQVVTVNLDFLRLGNRDHAFRELINTSNLVIADGMPLVWGSRLQGCGLPERVAGVDLVRECARLSAEKGYRIFFLGAGPGVADHAADTLRRQYPGAQIVGTYAPESMHGEVGEIATARIRDAAPDILFVALGAPLQDQWIRSHLAQLGVPVCMGIGGAFDMISGQVSRAPMWMQRTGMEWFYRFSQEPGRLWKRYFVHDLPIFVRLLHWTLQVSGTEATVQPVAVSEPVDVLPEAGVTAGV